MAAGIVYRDPISVYDVAAVFLKLTTSGVMGQNTYRRMLTFIMTPMANIIEASAEPP